MARQSDLLTALQRQLRALDDSALAALASVGLLRRARKDLEGYAPAHEVTDEHVKVDLGTHQVLVDRRGPAQARCTCRAKTTCQHVLSAWLYLASISVRESGTAGAGSSAPAEAGTAALHAELMALAVPDLAGFAGNTAVREALRILETAGTAEISAAQTIRIRLVHPPVELVYAGGGLEAFVTDYRGRQLKRIIVEGVLAYQMAHGVHPATEPGERQTNAKTEDAPTGEVVELREVLLQKVRSLLLECVAIGIVHLSESYIERFASLATVAEGAKLHRLSLSLSRLADLVELQLERNAQGDVSRLLDELAQAFALTAALGAGTQSPRRELIGESRTSYAQTTSLELYCAGAYPWQTASGYLGITVLFWSPAQSRWYSFSESRPLGTTGFIPKQRYRSPGPWQGCDSPAAIAGHHLRLLRPAVNYLGRLSASADTSAEVTPARKSSGFGLIAVKRWVDIAARSGGPAARAGFVEANPHDDYVLLQPSRYGARSYHGVEQEFLWPILDEVGETLLLRLPFTEASQHAIDRLEVLPPSEINAVIAKIEWSKYGRTALPLIVLSNRTDRPVDCIFFDDSLENSGIAVMTSKLRDTVSSVVSRTSGARAGVDRLSATDICLNTLNAELLKAAERGTASLGAGYGAVSVALARLTEAGLSLPYDITQVGAPFSAPAAAERILRIRFISQVAKQLGTQA